MIAILLSAYNGEKYIQEQLDSICNQTYSDWELYLRDDGSTDDTRAIIDNQIKKMPEKVKCLNGGNNLGVKNSFIELLKQVEATHYMFCDQDDIWLPQKIEKSIAKMKQVEAAHPKKAVLIHTDLTVVDADKNLVHSSFWKFSKLNPAILKTRNYLGVCNGLNGCTLLFNHKAKELALPLLDRANLHDWGMAYLVADKGIIDYLPESTVLYRQHEQNSVGASAVNRSYFAKKLFHLKTLITQNYCIYRHAAALNYGSFFKFLFYKVRYFCIRNKKFQF